MARILILFGSFDGHTAKIARRIGETLAKDGHTVDLRPVDAKEAGGDLGRCDAVIVGGAIHYGRFPKPLERLVRSHAASMAALPNAFFSVSLSARKPGGDIIVTRCVDEFRARTGWAPRETASFAGALLYREYNPFLRLVMKLVSRAAGGETDTSRDYEYTDWQAVDRFASRFSRERGDGSAVRRMPP